MEEALIKRVLPHSVEAEQSVIGSMIMDRDAIMTASEVITSEDFYQSQYGVLFDAMLELYNEGKPVDLVTLQERLREKDVPPEISSLEFVRDLLDAVPTSANVRHYATIVQEKSMLRKLIKVNEDIANTCYLAREKTEDILEETEKKIFDLLQYRSTGDFVPIKQVVLNALDKIEKASKNKGTVTGIPTGFIDLDYKTSGFQPSDLILIAARPSMGKTAFVLNVAQHMAFKEGKTVAIFSLEMSKEQLVNRLFSLESKVDSQALRTGNLTDEDWAKLIEGAAVVGKSNLIIDDTPEAITLSCFDQVRREIARIALEKLIADGRIHPTKIEEMVEKAKREVEQRIRVEGEHAVLETNVHGINNEMIKLLGRLYYRTSYRQNVLKHSIEVSKLCGVLASELGLDANMARRAGLLHDIGKALTAEIEGSHVQIGADLCRKYKESPIIVNAVEAHHGDVEPESLIACLVQAADAISAARPGARRETLETYTTRLKKLEDIANSYKGVEKTYAIQAGREIRVIVVPEHVNDSDMVLLARDIAKQIENELEYPGQIKVNIIRESRVVDYAK